MLVKLLTQPPVSPPLQKEVEPGKVVRYEERVDQPDVCGQSAYVNGAIKIAFVDRGCDGRVDQMFVDGNADGVLDSKNDYSPPFELKHWNAAAFTR
jgi:hypothetical protein